MAVVTSETVNTTAYLHISLAMPRFLREIYTFSTQQSYDSKGGWSNLRKYGCGSCQICQTCSAAPVLSSLHCLFSLAITCRIMRADGCVDELIVSGELGKLS